MTHRNHTQGMPRKNRTKYSRLGKADRAFIACMLPRKKSYAWIAQVLGVHRSTIAREVERNRDADGVYRAKHAERKKRLREKEKQKKNRKVENNLVLERYILEKLTQGWTPEQIAGRVRYCFFHRGENESCSDVPLPLLSREGELPSTLAIYRWIARTKRGLKRKLVHKGKRYRYKGNPYKKSPKLRIDARPLTIEERARVGDFEGDTLAGRGRKGERILTLVDRKSRFLFARRVDYDSTSVLKNILTLFRGNSTLPLTSITFDNGVEFAAWERMRDVLKVPIYFAYPYAPEQRGTNENTNRLVRRFFPKGTDFATISHNELTRVVDTLNNTPRKCLGFRTPREVYFSEN